MALDTENKGADLKKSIYGYNTDQVDGFLTQLKLKIKELNENNDNLINKLQYKENLLHEFNEREQKMQDSVSAAQRLGDKIRSDAQIQAQEIIIKIKKKSQELEKELNAKNNVIKQDINRLKDTRDHFEGQIKTLAKSYIEMIDQGKKIIPNPSQDSHINS